MFEMKKKKKKSPFVEIGGKGKMTGKSSPFEELESDLEPSVKSPEPELEPEMEEGLDAGFVSDEMSCSNCSNFSPEPPSCNLNVKGADYSKFSPEYSRCNKFSSGEEGEEKSVSLNEEKIPSSPAQIPGA